MNITYDVEIPRKKGCKCEDYDAVLNFSKSNSATMRIQYDSIDEARRRSYVLAPYVKRHKLPVVVSKRGDSVYFSKKGGLV